MADSSKLTVLCGLTIAVNTTWAVKSGREPVTPIVAGAVGYVGLSIVGGLWRWDIVNAIAGVFLLSALVFHGIPLGQSVARLASGKPQKSNTSKINQQIEDRTKFAGGGGKF